jgi:hypothetical protein
MHVTPSRNVPAQRVTTVPPTHLPAAPIAGYTARWAAACLVVNFVWPAVLHVGVSKVALALGPRCVPGDQ